MNHTSDDEHVNCKASFLELLQIIAILQSHPQATYLLFQRLFDAKPAAVPSERLTTFQTCREMFLECSRRHWSWHFSRQLLNSCRRACRQNDRSLLRGEKGPGYGLVDRYKRIDQGYRLHDPHLPSCSTCGPIFASALGAFSPV